MKNISVIFELNKFWQKSYIEHIKQGLGHYEAKRLTNDAYKDLKKLYDPIIDIEIEKQNIEGFEDNTTKEDMDHMNNEEQENTIGKKIKGFHFTKIHPEEKFPNFDWVNKLPIVDSSGFLTGEIINLDISKQPIVLVHDEDSPFEDEFAIYFDDLPKDKLIELVDKALSNGISVKL
ncbi:MAG: hypothetical protein ACOCQD_00860 [archaeon]